MERGERSDERSMEELGALAETAGAEVVAELIQTRAAPDPRSFIGDGKVQELKDLPRRVRQRAHPVADARAV